jgi:PKD repeat protein
VIQWKWDFGDGKISLERNPLHFYSTAGDTVLVCLTITTADGCESSYCTRFVVGTPDFTPPPCNTSFTTEVMESFPPIYRFVPALTQSTISCQWDFGDGSYSTETSPSHRYEFSGIYVVCLTMTFTNGCAAYTCDTLHATGYNNECKAGWVAYTDFSSPSGEPFDGDTAYWPSGHYYYFQDRSKGNITQWNWNFGDGTGSSEPNPVHVFNESGTYNVCLEISTYNNCTSTYCDTLFVGTVPYCSLTGTVVDYTGLDGCGLVIELDNGERLEPAEIVPNFVLKAGQRVRLSYTELRDWASICMVGRIVRIDCITEILGDSCKASFTYYAIPWISSWPPIYQFEDQSYGSKKRSYGILVTEPLPAISPPHTVTSIRVTTMSA